MTVIDWVATWNPKLVVAIEQRLVADYLIRVDYATEMLEDVEDK